MLRALSVNQHRSKKRKGYKTMSVIMPHYGRTTYPGFFLTTPACIRETVEIPKGHEQAVICPDGTQFVPAGTVYPANDETAAGIIYQDADIIGGSVKCSMVTHGSVFLNRLPVELSESAKKALSNKGFTFTTEPTATRD